MSENTEQELDLNQLMKVRREKLDELKENGKNPFEITKFNRTHFVQSKIAQIKYKAM